MSGKNFLAFDLGAESGRTVLGTLNDNRLTLKEINRFPNGMLNVLGTLRWNIFRLYEEMKRGMAVCASEFTGRLKSMAVDTWGVDFALLAEDGSILGLPFAYRDSGTDGAAEQFFKIVPKEEIYRLTGIQMLPFNTLFQLFSMAKSRSPILETATDLLFIPDLFNYLLSGVKRSEFTFATTSQLYDPMRDCWAPELFDALDIPVAIMQEVVQPGTAVGSLSGSISKETGLQEIPVVSTASHDTAAAVAAVPSAGDDFAYISSGTWSLVGVETRKPVINNDAMAYNFTNEGGVAGTNRLLKNVVGLWLVQECRRSWSREKEYSYAELTDLAASAPAFQAVIDPDWPGFLNPPDMPVAIGRYCCKTGQQVPASHGAFVRIALEGLALKYRMVLEQLEGLTSRSINRIHVIGGGARNKLLCRLTADATGLPVFAGPVEATAAGNIMVQALATGEVSGLAEIREIVRTSFELKRYEPEDTSRWDGVYERFVEIMESTPEL